MLLTLKNKIVLGTVQFGINYGISNSTGKTSVEEVSKILDMACQKGVSMLDTAQAYGSSEEILGKLHQNRFSIVTKLNSRLLNKQSATSLVEESLKKLKVESIHGVLFHSLINSSKDQQAFDELVHLKKKGITFLTSSEVINSKLTDSGVELDIKTSSNENKKITSDIVLSAVGIKTNIENIGLEEIGIKVKNDKSTSAN